MALSTSTAHALVKSRMRSIIAALQFPRTLTAFILEWAGLAAIVRGVYLWSQAAAWIVAGVVLVLEAYVVEKRRT